MEKNGGSCAGKRRFGVFVINTVSVRAPVMPGADPGAGFPARRRRAAGGRSRHRSGATGGKERRRAAVDSWPAVTALAQIAAAEGLADTGERRAPLPVGLPRARRTAAPDRGASAGACSVCVRLSA